VLVVEQRTRGRARVLACSALPGFEVGGAQAAAEHEDGVGGVLTLLNAEIAAQLLVSEQTVKTHVAR
jgi:ATP/maltotriose-dependent transcriptional regulator MalT